MSRQGMWTHRLCTIALSVAAVMAAPAGFVIATAPVATLQVRVLDVVTGKVLPSVEIAAGPFGRARTNTAGIASLAVTLGDVPTVEVPEQGDEGRFASLNVPLKVRPVREVVAVDYAVFLHGRIEGTVRDDVGRPVPSATVLAIGEEYSSVGPFTQRREVLPSDLQRFVLRHSTTNADGRFALTNLRPGVEIRVLVLPEPPRTPLPPSTVLSPGYFPAATAWHDALPIVLGSREHRTSVDVRLVRRDAGCVAVTVEREASLAGAQVAVVPEAAVGLRQYGATSDMPWVRPATDRPVRAARICGLAVGAHALIATDSLSNIAAFESATRRVMVEAGTEPSIVLVPRPPVSVQVTVENLTGSVASGPSLFFWPPSANPGPGQGQFELSRRGAFALQVQDLPANAYVHEVRVNGTPVRTAPLPAPSDPWSMTVQLRESATLTVGPSPLDEAVQTQWVALLPDLPPGSSDLAWSAAIDVQAVAPGESALFTSLRPGAYLMVELTVPPPHWLYRPTQRLHLVRSTTTIRALREAAQRGTRVDLRAGTTTLTHRKTSRTSTRDAWKWSMAQKQ